MTTSTQTKTEAALLDFGTGNMAIGVAGAVRYEPILNPADGLQTESCALEDENGDWHFGSDAYLAAIDSARPIYMHMKRNLPLRAEEKIYGGKYTPIDVAGRLLGFGRELLLAARPDLAELSAFGGDKDSSHFAMCLSVPADWTIQEHAHLRQAATLAGFSEIAGFLPEPICAARRLAEIGSIELRSGQKIYVIDVGAGTCDNVILEVGSDGALLHQISAASGNSFLAGHDFTHAIAVDIAAECRVSLKGVYTREGGLNLSQVARKQLASVTGVWVAAVKVKEKLSVSAKASVPVDLGKGRKTYSIDRDKAKTLWARLFSDFERCLRESFEDGKLRPADIDHILLAGGSSPIPGLRDAAARGLEVDSKRVFVSTDSAHIVAQGGAQMALYQDGAKTVLESGMGLNISNSAGRRVNRLFVSPGKVLPAEGLFEEFDGFVIDTRGKKALEISPFVAKRGVKQEVNGATLLPDSQILELEDIEVPAVDTFGPGVHEISLGIKVDPTRNLWLLVRPKHLPNVEALSIKLEMSARQKKATPIDVVLVLDCSGSMAGVKIDALRDGATEFAERVIASGARVGIVKFGSNAALVCAPSRDLNAVKQAIAKLQATGATPMREAIEISGDELDKLEANWQSLVAIFSDGQPNSDPLPAATKLKERFRIATVGIGDDCVVPLMKELASEGLYRFGKGPDDLLSNFQWLARIVSNDSNTTNDTEQSRETLSTDEMRSEETVAFEDDFEDDDYDDDWDDMEHVA